MNTDPASRGERAERQALDYLQKNGLKPVVKNYRCRNGELDLIMQDGKTLVVVEVRYRASSRFGGAAESVTRKKQSRIIAATQHYLMNYPRDSAIRFDVVAINGDSSIDWIRNAFQT